MEYRERLPHPALRPFVRVCWTLTDDGRGGAGAQPILPDGCSELVVHRAHPFRRITGALDEAQAPLLFFVGQMRQPVLLAPGGAAEAVGLRFQSHGAYALLGLPQHALVDAIAPADALGLPWLSAALRRARDAPTSAAASEALEDALLRRLAQRTGARDPRVDAAVALVAGSDGAVSVEAAAARAGTSTRHLERLFRDWVGLGPKALCRVARFQAAAARVRHEPALPLAAVSADSGYFDQAHMVRDFLALGGTSPNQMRRGLGRITAAMMMSRAWDD